MADAIRIARISDEPLDLAAHIAAVSGPTAGGIATFVGTVRDHDPGARGEVTLLEYSSHPDAERILGGIAASCLAETEAECAIAVTHRIGKLGVGEILFVGMSPSATPLATWIGLKSSSEVSGQQGNACPLFT